MILRPTMAGSAPYRRRQHPFESNTTWSAPGCSSSGRKFRPSAGFTPMSGKNSAETRIPGTRSGSARLSATLKNTYRKAAMRSKTWFCSRQSL
jgi:hypothetical protein